MTIYHKNNLMFKTMISGRAIAFTRPAAGLELRTGYFCDFIKLT